MRTWIRWASAAAAVTLVAGVAEFGFSIFAEEAFAAALLRNPTIHAQPEVTLKSFPNVVKLPRGETGGLLINLNDQPDAALDIPRANVQVEYSNLRFDRNALFGDRIRDFSFGEGTGRVYISGSTLALVSHIPDLQFQAADDASPAGVGEDKALLSGTITLRCASGMAPVYVAVRAHVFFWKEGQRLEIDPEKIEKAKGLDSSAGCSHTPDWEKQVMDKMSLSLQVPSLPLGIVPKLAFAQSGNLVIVGPTDQSPLSGKVRARYPGGTSSQARWDNLTNYFKFAPL